jgi:peptidyl-prolyl cis-trans isomerase C
MKSVIYLLLAIATLAAQEMPKSDTVVAIIDGKPLTAGELLGLLRLSGPQALQNFKTNPEAYLRQIAHMRYLSAEAEKNKLDQKSPYQDQLEFNRQLVLFNAQAQTFFDNLTVSPDEQKHFYEVNKDRYREVQVKAIYVAFSKVAVGGGGGTSLTEDQAREKAVGLVKQIRAGADFVKLVKENSDDRSSAAKDGDYGVIRQSDKIDASILKAIFALKPGEISDPVRSTNGFYIFRAEKNDYKPFDQVKDDIFIEIKRNQQKAYLDRTRDGRQVKIENADALRALAPK